MRESLWGYWIVILGVFVIVIMMLISNVTTTNTQDYYLIKEVTEQAMVDAVDLGYYRTSRELKINADKFVESFLRRFAENVVLSTYTVEFYGIYEAPPKVSVKVTTESNSFMVGTSSDSFEIVNKVDAILELDGTVSSENIDVVTGLTGGSGDETSGGAANDGTSTIPDSQIDDPQGENYAPNIDDLDDIIANHPEDFYNEVKTGAAKSEWEKVNKTIFFENAKKYFEILTGRELTAEQKRTLENVINKYYNSYANKISTRPGQIPTFEQIKAQSSNNSSSNNSESSNKKHDEDYTFQFKDVLGLFENQCTKCELFDSYQSDDDHTTYEIKPFEEFCDSVKFILEDTKDGGFDDFDEGDIEEYCQKIYDDEIYASKKEPFTFRDTNNPCMKCN